jgi:hypothetical protein
MADIRINALPTTATDFASDDYIAIDGTTNGTRKLNAKTANLTFSDVTLGSSGPSVKSSLSARAPRQGLVFDGTAGATVSIPAFGTGNWSFVFWSNPSSFPSAINHVTGGSSALAIYFDASGTIGVGQDDVSAGSTSFNASGTIGKTDAWAVVTSSGVTTVYKNGVATGSQTLGLNFSSAISKIGSAPDGTSLTYFGGLSGVLAYNRALSASEVVSLYEAGAPAGADYNSASNTSLITGDNSTFASDTGYWTKSIATISGGNLNLSSDASYIFRANLLVIGKKYRYVTSISANTTSVLIGSGSGAGYGTVTTTGTITGEFTATSTTFVIYQSGAGAATVGDITLFSLGLLLAPDAAQAGGGLVWYDTSGNAANITLPASGVTWNVPSSRYLGGNWTTSGNLTVSGTGTSTFSSIVDINNDLYIGAGNILALARNNPTYNTIKRDTTNGGILLTANSNQLFFKDNGNLLLGTVIDGGQKLQVNGTAYVSGNATFAGTVRSNTQEGFKIAAASGYFAGYEADGTTLNGYLQFINSVGTLLNQSIAGKNIALAIAGTPQLTLTTGDATFAGNIQGTTGNTRLKNIGADASSTPVVVFDDSSGGSATHTLVSLQRSETEVGTITVSNTTTGFNSTSDVRLKTNIRDFTNSGAIIDSIKPRIFDWKTGEKDTVGFVAQELNAVFPQAVAVGDSDPDTITNRWALDASKLVPVLVAEIKALRVRVAALENN